MFEWRQDVGTSWSFRFDEPRDAAANELARSD
jgi:hypothetical protein